MSRQKAAEYISVLFRKTYDKPDDILSDFTTALSKVIFYLENEPLSGPEMDAKLKLLSEEIWGRMDYISNDIIRCRVNDELMLRYYDLDNGLISTGSNRHFDDIISDLMKALISMVFAEKKQGLRIARSGASKLPSEV